MVTSVKRVSLFLLIIVALAIIPILSSNSNTVHAAKQDDISKVANAKKGKRIGHFKGEGFHRGAWCADFVYWAAKEAKLTNNKTFPKKKVSSVRSFQSYYKQKGLYKKATKKFKPQKGDLAIFGSSSHVGIVTKAKGNYVWVTHGNWSNKVCVTKIKKTGYDRSAYAKIKGYCRLDYKVSEPKVKIKFENNEENTKIEFKTKKIRNTDKIGTLPKVAINEVNEDLKLMDDENEDQIEEEIEEPEVQKVFKGWYTKKKGGKKITKKYLVDVDKELVVYAQYK